MGLREYGLPNSEPCGTPTWKPAEGVPPCPNCGGAVCEVEVLVKQELLKGGVGTATYFGCPACPWASPAMLTAKKQAKEANA